MKKLLYLIATALVMHACIDDENIVDYKTYPFSVQLVYPDGYAAREGIPVHLLNTTTGVAFDTITDAAGRASFIVAPGIYELSTTDKRPDIGGIVNILNGARNNIAITALSNTSAPYQLPMTLSRAGQVIVKELYIGGCPKDDGSGTFQMDKYAILYNNSEYAASLDSVAFGMIYPYNANNTNAYYDANGNLAYENAGWVPAGSGFWYFPNIVSLQPGEQIVVAINGAIDNTATYSQSVNLANENYYCMYDIADFNNVLYHPSPSTLIPASHYLLAYRFALGNSWVLSTNSPCFIIFTPKGVSLREFTNDAATTDPESGTTLTRKMLPTDWILDGVEVYRRGYDNNLKRAPAFVDAGYVYHDTGMGYTIYRNVDAEATLAIEGNADKIVYNYALGTASQGGTTDPSGIDAEASAKNGARVIYKDTNNSTNDFHLRARASLRN